MGAFVSRVSKWAGILLILATGVIHLIETPHHFEAAAYVGWLFVGNFVGSLLAAFGIYRGALWGWLLGALIAAGAFVLFLVSRTLGLPQTGGEFVGHWDAIGILSLIVEGLFVALFLSATTLRR